jgi:hypothetical protein
MAFDSTGFLVSISISEPPVKSIESLRPYLAKEIRPGTSKRIEITK